MASHVYVVDSTFKRQQIKVSPNTYLRDVLEEACEKMKLANPDQYALKTDKKELDLSIQWRISGLPSGAKLQLVQASKSPSVVNVALQLPESEKGIRLQDKFASNTSLWLVLRKFEEGVAGGGSAQKLNLTSRGVPSTDSGSGRLNHEQPCLNLVGREMSTFTDLQKTFAQLGFNKGSVLLRLTFSNNGLAMEEAMAQISDYFKSALPAQQSQPKPADGAHADVEMTSAPNALAENAAAPVQEEAAQEPSSEDTVMSPAPPLESQTSYQENESDIIASSSVTAVPTTASQFPFIQQQEDTAPTPPSTSSPALTSSSSQPKVSVYSAPTANVPRAALRPHNEADFAPSIEHAQAHQAVLNRQSQNKRLASDRELEAAAASKAQALKDIKSVLVRIRFPDQMQADLVMEAQETVATMYETVKSMLDRPNQPFELRYSGQRAKQEKLEPGSQKLLIKDLGMIGRVLVTMVWADSVNISDRVGHSLKPEYRQQAKALEVKEIEAKEEKIDEETKTDGKKPEAKKKPVDRGAKEARLLKMMGFGKK